MTPPERDAFLREQRTCRVATASPVGQPHASPLWFIWDGNSLWLYSLTRSRRWVDIARNPNVAVVVDTGDSYNELRGVELVGSVTVVGEIPRLGKVPAPELEAVERDFALKYTGSPAKSHDGRHAWLKITPEHEFTWDFRKISADAGA